MSLYRYEAAAASGELVTGEMGFPMAFPRKLRDAAEQKAVVQVSSQPE